MPSFSQLSRNVIIIKNISQFQEITILLLVSVAYLLHDEHSS